MQHQRIIAHARIEQRAFDCLESIEIEMLLSLEFIGPVGVSDRDSEGIHPGLPHKLNRLLRLRVMTAGRVIAPLFAVIELGTDKMTQLAFHHAIVLVGVVDDLTADLDILFERFVGGINHDTRKALINALLAQIKGVPVIEMNRQRDGREADRRFDELLEINRMRVITGTARNLEHHWRLFFLAGLDDGLRHLHVVHVERAEGVLAFQGLGEQIVGMCEWHKILRQF